MDSQQNKTEKKQKRAPIGVFDVFIIVALIVCIIAAGFAFVFKRDNGEVVIHENDKEEFAVTFECKSISKQHAQLLRDGDKYFLPDNEELGLISGNVTITPAVIYAQCDDGTYVRTFAPENGDDTLVDVAGTVIVRGARNSGGILEVGNAFGLIPGYSFIMHSSTVSVRITVDAVEKVSK